MLGLKAFKIKMQQHTEPALTEVMTVYHNVESNRTL